MRILEDKDIGFLGQHLIKSHESLKKDYCASTEKLDFLVKKITSINDKYGARLMGGGFGGCVPKPD